MGPLLEVIVLAGGCFWGVEQLVRKIPGVVKTEVGYAGGTTKSPTYEQVKTGTTGHAEVVRVEFDPKKLPLKTLLKDHFFKLHDPTQLNRQENDIGTQYRSAVFFTKASQKVVAEEVIAEVIKSGFWKKPIVTKVEEAPEFYPAEGYHQDYLLKNPNGYNCHYYR